MSAATWCQRSAPFYAVCAISCLPSPSRRERLRCPLRYASTPPEPRPVRLMSALPPRERIQVPRVSAKIFDQKVERQSPRNLRGVGPFPPSAAAVIGTRL